MNVPLNRVRAWAPISAAFNAISSPYWTGSGGGRFVFPAIPTTWGNAKGWAAVGGWNWRMGEPTRVPSPTSHGEHTSLHTRNPHRDPPGPSCSSVIINFATKAGDHYTPIPPPFCLLPTPTPRSPHAWIRYIPPALPDVSIPWSPDRAIIYQVVSRVVGEGGPGGRGFVSSLCWSSTGPSSLVSSQLLRVAGVREQMLKGLPFICGLILMPFHFILPASGMLLAYTPPHPPHYHSVCMFLREQELIFHVLVSSPPTPQLLLSPAHSASVSVFSPLAFFSSLNVRYHKSNSVKGKSCSGSLSLPCKRFGVLQPFMLLLCMPGRWVTT